MLEEGFLEFYLGKKTPQNTKVYQFKLEAYKLQARELRSQKQTNSWE